MIAGVMVQDMGQRAQLLQEIGHFFLLLLAGKHILCVQVGEHHTRQWLLVHIASGPFLGGSEKDGFPDDALWF